MSMDLAASTILYRAAHNIDEWGLVKGDFYDHWDGGYDVCGAIANSSGLDFDDWHDRPTTSCDDEDPDEHSRWLASRAASLAALRTFLGHVYPDARPEEMSRDALIVKAGEWNDHPDRTDAQVIAKLRESAVDTVTAWLVWSNEHRCWWGPNFSGYTNDVLQAGRYTREQSVEACGRRSWEPGKPPPEVMVAAPEDGRSQAFTGDEFRQVDAWMTARIDESTRRSTASRSSQQAVASDA